MPKELDDCVKKLMNEGKTEEEAWAICTAELKKQGIIEKDKPKKGWM